MCTYYWQLFLKKKFALLKMIELFKIKCELLTIICIMTIIVLKLKINIIIV